MEAIHQSRLALGAGELWERGTRAAFLDAVGDGSLPRETFHRWLQQDHLFVRGLARFLALTVARTERPTQSVVIAGLGALDEELGWFEGHLERLGLSPSPAPHPACRRYLDFLQATAYTRPPEVLLAVLYGVEAAYCASWGRLSPEGPWADFIRRWTSPGFQEYVLALRDLADEHPHPDQQEAFDRVMRHEEGFWRMTWSGEGPGGAGC